MGTAQWVENQSVDRKQAPGKLRKDSFRAAAGQRAAERSVLKLRFPLRMSDGRFPRAVLALTDLGHGELRISKALKDESCSSIPLGTPLTR
jgi:hypothetical protein